jgi:hypothetical protein
MEAVRTSETLVNIYLTTRKYISEDSKLHTRRRENLKSHIVVRVLIFTFIDTKLEDRMFWTEWYQSISHFNFLLTLSSITLSFQVYNSLVFDK